MRSVGRARRGPSQRASRAAAWVSAEDLAADVDTSVLPVLGPDSLSPMQEFYIISDSGDEDTGCETAPPSGVLLQGPENIESDVLINGVHVRISSTVFVQMVDGVLHFTTLSGLVVLEPNTDQNANILAWLLRCGHMHINKRAPEMSNAEIVFGGRIFYFIVTCNQNK